MSAALDAFLRGTRDAHVLVVGDVMVDAYLWGRVDRISPEAPVPVVQVQRRSARLGGAANVALNTQALGARTTVATVIGEDDNAATLQRLFAEQGMSTEGLVRSAARRTTVKTRVISGHQHIVRVDEEQEDELQGPDVERLVKVVRGIMEQTRPDVLVFEDYDKGTLTPQLIQSVMESARQAGVPVAVDPKKRNFLTYEGVDLFKPNLKELSEGLKTDVAPEDLDSVRAAVRMMEERLGNKATLLTLSEHGIYAHGAGGEHRVAAHKRKIVDVSGAGDTVIAVAALALAGGLPLRQVAELSNLAGGLVCEEVGVAPLDATRFRSECERLGLPG